MRTSKFKAALVDAAFLSSIKSQQSLRFELIGILKHRKLSLDKSKPFKGKAPKMAAVVQLLNRFENLSKVSDQVLKTIIKDEAPRLLYLYSEQTDFPNQRQRILEIVNNAINQ